MYSPTKIFKAEASEKRKVGPYTGNVFITEKLGRWLKPWEQVRHIDGNRNNNHHG